MPDHSIAERIASIRPKISPALLEGKSEFEKLMLQQNDIGFQQNEALAEAADEIRSKLIEVHGQTTLTNGRVTATEKQIQEHDEILRGYQKAAAKRTKIMVSLIPIIGVVLEIFAKKLGLL
jgi:hypothetical protein